MEARTHEDLVVGFDNGWEATSWEAVWPANADRSERTGARRGWLMRRALVAADLAGLMIAFAISLVLVSANSAVGAVNERHEVLLFGASLGVWILLAKLQGLYDRDEERTGHSTVDDIIGVFHVVTIGTWGFLVGAYFTGLANPQFAKLILFWALAIVLVPSTRALARVLAHRSDAYVQRVIVVGSGQVGRHVAIKMLSHPEYGLDVIGFVDSDPPATELGPRSLGEVEDLPRLVQQFDIDRVVIAFSLDTHERMLEVIRTLQDLQVQVDVVPRLFEVLGSKVHIHSVEGVPLLSLTRPSLPPSARIMKRTFDIVASVASLIVLAPLFLVVGVAIRLESRGPVFFRQYRIGENDQPFRIFKFRTMVVDAEGQKEDVAHLNMHRNVDSRMFKVPNDPRVTRVGGLLRRLSIDELPQLINVVRGEMSLVGPRPLIPEEDCYVTDWARKRLSIRPGITGLWQVLGRSDIPFQEMTKLDYLYVTNWSLSEDLRLIFLTVPSLVRKRRAF